MKETTKDRIVTVIIALGIVLLAWKVGIFSFNHDPNEPDPLVVEHWHRGHLYLQDLRFRGGALTHSPDCPCHQKKGEKDER